MTKVQVTQVLNDLGEKYNTVTELEGVSYMHILSGGISIATFDKTFMFDGDKELMFEYVDGELNNIIPFGEIASFNLVCYVTPKHPQINGGSR